MTAEITYLNFINGVWKKGSGTRSVENVNPANRKVLGMIYESSKADVDVAVQAAVQAQKTWRLVPAPARGEFLFRIGELLRKNKERLAQLLTSEMGKVIAEARGEVQEAIDMAYFMGGEGRRLVGQTVPSELPNKQAMSFRAPVGVAGLITPWNFPIAIASWKIFPALVSGNSVVWKPATDTPALAYEFVKLIEEAGVPKGVINLVFGSGSTVGTALVEHPDVNIVSFTGSTEVGRAISSKAGEQFKKVSLEMGGKNAIIVMDDADLDLAVDGIIWSAFGTAGQRCTACSRLIVHEPIKEDLENRLLSRISELKMGDGLDETVQIGPVINEPALKSIHEYVRIGQEEGANLLCGGQILKSGDCQNGFFYAPTLFTNVNREMRVAREEIFGPVLSIISVTSLEEAIEVNNEVNYGLSSSIFTNDTNRTFIAMRDLDTGIVYINAGTIGAEIHLPFGGTKHTGNGHRDSGVVALDVFTEWKSVYVDYSQKLQRAQIDNN
ncbi:aldehyde dehydrogenase family protein [Pullulanibacillus sp. KACC 23026]|uniref:aldehyde dehydrogenase family protein n=1 Tax=Pullulanibacillus sp. KACC 23026 TaxID=3028315 RepID=UPI0023B123EF|nr:aldehyde dehydrogenase family protein [Pullulanibacillus sp. KACC 23026]WEG14400.1 aldehyde dehydrogenase family protein [Pullulanibacillus sp. KACC 23026]